MNFAKLLAHDLRCGALRWRYLLAALFFLLPCIQLRSHLALMETGGTFGDYLMYCFMGSVPFDAITGEPDLQLPVLWLLVMGGCLLLNLDYLLYDLTNAGQQVIVRSGARRDWYLSKCLWNCIACCVYFLLACLSVLAFVLATGGQAVWENTPAITLSRFYRVVNDVVFLSPGQVMICAALLPLLTVMALSILEMTLCLFLKPIISFLITMLLLITAVYWNSPFVFGTGGMVMRSRFLAVDGADPVISIVFALLILVGSILAGSLRFRRTDILGLEE